MRDELMRRLAEKCLKLSPADQTEVSVYVEDSSLTRFANNEIHQNVAMRDVNVSIRACVEKRYGVASTNDLSEKGLQSAIDQAVAIARVLPVQEEFLPLPPPQPAPEADGYVLQTSEFGPLQRAAGVRVVCERARERGLTAAGAFKVDITGLTIANSGGLYAEHSSTSAELMAVTMSDDSSGFAARLTSNAEEIDPEAVAREAVEKAGKGRNPRAIDPGEYEVVLEPYAVSDILDFLSFLGFGALPVQEGRSFMSGKIGQPVMGPNVSIWDDGLDPAGLVRPFDFEGVPKQRVDIIVDGVVNSPCHDRRTALKENKVSTGHALPAGFTAGPVPLNMFLKPGDATMDKLIGSVRRGLLVTRFWYTRVVHPKTAKITGMTRDGTFLIENGEIVAPVKNLRFTHSYVDALNHVEALGRDTRLVRDLMAANRVPALRVSGWTFTGATEY